MAVKLTLKNGKEIKQDFVAAGTVRDVMKFGRRLENGEVDVLEMLETFVRMVVDLFPKEKNLEEILWSEYTADELSDFCQSALMQVTGGGGEEEPSGEK